jgi:adenylyl cyclase-associated protein
VPVNETFTRSRISLVDRPVAAGKKPVRPAKPQSLMSKKPSKFALEGNKWMIVNIPFRGFRRVLTLDQEYQENESLVVEDGQINHTVILYGCKNSTVVIKGKVNTVTLSAFLHPHTIEDEVY